MERCPRCSSFVDTGRAYCQTCNRSRILESLRAPWSRPAWQDQAWRGATVVVSLWLVVTVAVAFLREAKAVRDSRQHLAAAQPELAWARLEPFLKDHPRHRQALLLCGKATVRLDRRTEAKDCLDRLDKRSPELAQELRKDYAEVLPEVTRKLVCQAAAFQERLAWAGTLGAGFDSHVIAGLDGVVATCRATQASSEIAKIAESLAEQGRAVALVERGYVPAIQQAMRKRQYDEAKVLARQAGSLVPAGAAAVDAALDGERRKVSATMVTLRQLVTALRADQSFRAGSQGCFPETAPAVVQAARDGWGSPVQYNPENAYDAPSGKRCHYGFTLFSSHAGVEAAQENGQGTPAMLYCNGYVQWENCQFPERFWQVAAG